MDNNHQFLRIAKRRQRENFLKNIEFMNLSNLELYEEEFDIVLIFFALNDLSMESIKKLLEKLRSILLSNKKLIIVDYTTSKHFLSQFLMKINQKVFFNKHFNVFIDCDICELLQDLGFKIASVEEIKNIKIISCLNSEV